VYNYFHPTTTLYRLKPRKKEKKQPTTRYNAYTIPRKRIKSTVELMSPKTKTRHEFRTQHSSIGQNPLPMAPLMMNPNRRNMIRNLLISGRKIHVVMLGVFFPGDLAEPPAVVVEGVDALVEREIGFGDTWRLGTEFFGEKGFGKGLL